MRTAGLSAPSYVEDRTVQNVLETVSQAAPVERDDTPEETCGVGQGSSRTGPRRSHSPSSAHRRPEEGLRDLPPVARRVPAPHQVAEEAVMTLTDRDVQALRLLAVGRSTAQISD